MARIAIFTSSDYVWTFTAWKQTIPLLQKRHEVAGVFLFPDQLGRYKESHIPLWYLRVFGFRNAVIFAAYACKTRLCQMFSSPRTWRGLGRAYSIELHAAETPNAPAVREWVKEQNIDIIFITVGQVLHKEIIETPRKGIINKHAALLPSCRGLFPFFWGIVHELPVGVTFHTVTSRIDAGKILVQKEYNRHQSMLRFYLRVFYDFPLLALEAVERLLKRDYQAPRLDVAASYYSLPTKKDFKQFPGKIAKIADLFYEVRRDQF